MKYLIEFSGDNLIPNDEWTEEFYDTKEKAEQVLLNLLYSGFYVRLSQIEG